VNVFFDDASFDVTPPSGLTASIFSPTNSSTVGANFTITATASVSPGAVTNVYFYVDNVLQGNDDTAPYSYSVVGASVGAHNLKVVAKADTGASVTSSVVNITVVTAATVTVDPTKTWNGYMVVFETPANGGAYVFDNGWGTADLRASFSGSTLTLSPNTIADPAPFWYTPAGGPGSTGNKIMQALMYVETAALNGLTVTFAGKCITNNMTTNGVFVGPANADGNGWTCVAFIKEFTMPGYNLVNSTTTAVTNGSTFSISLNTVSDPNRLVQYGFQTVGPCVWPTDPVLATYGNVQIGPVASSPTIVASKSGSNISMSFPTQTGYAYTVQYRTNLSVGAWSTLTTTNGTGANAVVTDSLGGAQRFYRVSVE